MVVIQTEVNHSIALILEIVKLHYMLSKHQVPGIIAGKENVPVISADHLYLKGARDMKCDKYPETHVLSSLGIVNDMVP